MKIGILNYIYIIDKQELDFGSNLLMLFTTVATASNIVNVIPANINGTYFNIQKLYIIPFPYVDVSIWLKLSMKAYKAD